MLLHGDMMGLCVRGVRLEANCEDRVTVNVVFMKAEQRVSVHESVLKDAGRDETLRR